MFPAVRLAYQRRAEPLSCQRLQPKYKQGMAIASERALKLLIYDYTQILLEVSKADVRATAASRLIYEDADLERRYEKLPMSLLLKSY